MEQRRIDTLQPNQYHNLQDPSKILKKRRQKSKCKSENFNIMAKKIINIKQFYPIFDMIIKDPDFEILQPFDLSMDEYKNYSNHVFFKIY